MSIQVFQEWVRGRWGGRPQGVDTAVMTLGLMGEIAEVLQECVNLTIAGGEVSEHIKKEIRGSKPVDVTKLVLELGDVQHYLCCIANRYGIDMEMVMAENVRKLVEREAVQRALKAKP